MTRRTIIMAAIVAAVIVTGPAAMARHLSGDNYGPADGDRTSVIVLERVRTIYLESPSVAIVWTCPDDTDIMTADGACHDIDRYLDEWITANGPDHPADRCQEDESWTAVDYRSSDGIEDIHGVTRACRPVDGA